MNLKLSKEQLQKLILGGIGGIIVLLLLVNFVLVPSIRRISDLKNKIGEQKEKLANAEADIEGLPRLKSNLKKLEEKLIKYHTDMPQLTPDWFLDKLNSIAVEIGINFEKIEPKGITKSDKYSLQELDLELITDYHSLGKFINKLENASPFLKVIDLSIMSNKDNIVKHNIKLTIGAYVSDKK